MASSATLLYESQQEVGGHTFYQLRLDLIPEAYEAIIALLLYIIGEGLPDELALLDLPFLIPETIPSGTTLANYGGTGSYTLPESIYFAYAKGSPHIHAVYDIDTPEQSDIAMAQAFLSETEIWYCDIAPESIPSWPSGDGPDSHPPDATGWNYPSLLEDWGWVEDTNVAGRYLNPWYYTDVYFEYLGVIWAGCTDWETDEDHFLNNTPSQYFGNRVRFSEPNYIYSCNEESSGFLYWIERETIGNVETISVWVFQADDPAYFYPHLVSPVEVPKASPVLFLPNLMALAKMLPFFVPKHNMDFCFHPVLNAAEPISSDRLIVNTDDLLIINTNDYLEVA